MNKLYYLGQPGDGFGWGVANTNLITALRQLCEVETAPRTRRNFDAPIFVPIAKPDLSPDVKYAAPRVIGYCFTEWPLPENSKRNARAYDLIFCGSTWNTQKLKSAGIKHVETLLQGIDHSRFFPQPPSDRKGFVVFSGGKYEFRKGQDYVIAAMEQFMQRHADVVLMAAWENKWAESVLSMRNSWLVDFDDPLKNLPQDRVILVPPVPNEKMPALYAQAHIGLFPNRCEAGTNLVMCEFMACGRPVIATYAHGHRDVIDVSNVGPYLLMNGSYDPAGWFNPEVPDILAALEDAYTHREALVELGKDCAALTRGLTWESCAKKIVAAAFP